MINYNDYLFLLGKQDSEITYIDFLIDIGGNSYDEAARYSKLFYTKGETK